LSPVRTAGGEPRDWKKLDAPDPQHSQPVYSKSPLPVWDVVDALGWRQSGARASTFVRLLIRRCWTSSSIDVAEILHPAPQWGAPSTIAARKRISRPASPATGCPANPAPDVRDPCASSGSSRTLVRTEHARRWTAIVSLPNCAIGGHRSASFYMTLIRPSQSSRRHFCSRWCELSNPAARAKIAARCSQTQPRGGSLSLPRDRCAASSQNVAGITEPRQSLSPWLRRSLWLVAVWGVSEALAD
jgi:hypothetical protein